VIGGRPRQVTVDIDPARLASHAVDPLMIRDTLAAANVRVPGGPIVSANRTWVVDSGQWLESVDDVRNLVLVSRQGAPLRLSDVASVVDGAGEPVSYVMQHPRSGHAYPAVTLSIAKRTGANAIALTTAIERRVEALRGHLLPADLEISVTRNYGETAAHKSNELLWHMLLAVVSV